MRSASPHLPGQPKETKRVKARRALLKSRYGITYEEFCQMHFDQCEMCAVCGCHIGIIKSDGGPPTAHVDHDHETGKIRGLLCGNCNLGLGMFKDDKEILNDAIDYLLERETLS